MIHLIEIDIIRAPIRRRNVLEEKDVEEPAEKSVPLHEGLDCPAFDCQFLLDATDEDLRAGLVHGGMVLKPSAHFKFNASQFNASQLIPVHL